MTTDPVLPVERLEATTSSGRPVAVWRSSPEPAAGAAPVVVLSPGFARRMRHVGAVALYLVRNGVVVYRVDSLDHIGLSDGEMRNFTLSAAMESIDAAVNVAVEREPCSYVTVVAASLAGRAAIRAATLTTRIARLVLLVGVVNGQMTVENVLGPELANTATEALPDEVVAEGHVVLARNFARDARTNGWDSLDRTIEELRQISVPVYNFYGEHDRWVAESDVKRAFEEGDGGLRYLFQLPYGEHDLGQNPAALKFVLIRATAASLGAYERSAAPEPVIARLKAPTFEEIVELAIQERATEAAAMAGPASGFTSGTPSRK